MAPRRVPAAAALAAALLALLALGPAAAEDAEPVVYTSEPDLVLVEDARWFVAEAHAPADGRFVGHTLLKMKRPPPRIRSVFALFDEDWTPQAFATVDKGPFPSPSVVRAQGPAGADRRIQVPSRGAVDDDPEPVERAGAEWRLEGDQDGTTLVGYVAVLTEARHPSLRVQVPDGWVGDHTQGAAGVHVREVRNFDQVGLHAKATLSGPSVTMDAREERAVDGFLAGAMDLTPGRGQASASGPAGSTCAGDCPHRTALAGPAGDYSFTVDRHTQVRGPEPWVATADVTRP